MQCTIEALPFKKNFINTYLNKKLYLQYFWKMKVQQSRFYVKKIVKGLKALEKTINVPTFATSELGAHLFKQRLLVPSFAHSDLGAQIEKNGTNLNFTEYSWMGWSKSGISLKCHRCINFTPHTINEYSMKIPFSDIFL